MPARREGDEPLSDPKERFREEQARLAGLSRAQRFEALMSFPVCHTFKVIGPREGLKDAVSRVLLGLGFTAVTFSERLSSGKRHVSLSFDLDILSGVQLDTVYTALEQIQGATYVF